MVNLRELATPLLARVRGQLWDDSSMVERRILIPRVPGSIPGHLTTEELQEKEVIHGKE